MADGDIQAVAADGSTHVFPSGTDPSVIDGAMKRYAQSNAAATQSTATISASPSALGSLGKAATAVGRAAVNSSFPYVHPLDAMGAIQDQALKVTEPIENYTQQGRAEHPVLSSLGDLTSAAKELALGGKTAGKPMGTSAGVVNNPVTMAMSAAPGAAEAVPAIGERAAAGINALREGSARKLVQPLVYEGPGEAMADTRMGQQPDRAIVREGISGTKSGMISQIDDRLGELKETSNRILQNHPNAQTMIDVNPEIDSAIDSALKNTQQVAGSTERLEALRGQLKSQYGSTSGTPLEMNNLKTKIQEAASRVGAYRNTQPEEGTVADALSAAARNIKDRVNTTIPEVAPLNERMADLADARSGLSRKVAISKGEDLFSGDLTALPSRVLRRTIGSAPVRSGLARLATVGLKEDIPEVSEPIGSARVDDSSAESVPYNRLARDPNRSYRTPSQPIITPRPADASGPIPASGVSVEPTTRAQRLGLLLPEAQEARVPLVTPQPKIDLLEEKTSAPTITPPPKESAREYLKRLGRIQRSQ